MYKCKYRRIIRPLDESILNEAIDVADVDIVAETNDVTNDILNDVAVVIATKVVKATTLFMNDPVVEVKANKRGKPTLAEAALKLDKLQQTQKNQPIIAKRSSTRIKKQHENILNIIFFNFFRNAK
jgi:hypothetical protein